jgi:hypothetical protein
MNPTCWFFERALSARVMRGETAPLPDSVLGKHLSTCSHCRQVSSELSQLHKTLPAMSTPMVHIDFEERVLEKLRSAKLSPLPRAGYPAAGCGRKLHEPASDALRGTGAVAALVACGGLIFWLNKPVQHPVPQDNKLAPVATQHPEQYTKTNGLDHRRRQQSHKPVVLVHQQGPQSHKPIALVHQQGQQYQKHIVFNNKQVRQFPKPIRLDHRRKLQYTKPDQLVHRRGQQYTELTAGDIAYLNADGFDGYARRASALLQLDPDPILKALPETTKGDDFVSVPVPQLASSSRSAMAEALNRYEQEKQSVDARLQHKITLGLKRVSFAELCEKLAKETGIEIVASRSVADEKLTVFCKDKPVRDLMRQITRLFGFVWERNGTEENFRYKLTEPLKVRILEEELRNRDRNEALLALDREMDAYKDLLNLSPEEARTREEATTDEKQKERLKMLGGIGWGPARLYGSLSSDERDTLLSGKKLSFAGDGGVNGALPLPQSLRDTVLKSLRGHAFIDPKAERTALYSDRNDEATRNETGLSPDQIPGYTPYAALSLQRTELGEYALGGHTGFGDGGNFGSTGVTMAKGVSPSAASPENAKANEKRKNEPLYQKKIALSADAKTSGDPKRKLTTADLLEAIHKATGRDVIGDYFTRLHEPQKLWGKSSAPLFEALNRSCDATRLRWEEKDGFLTFRSTDFFNMRLKEVPNRLLDRWSQLRKEKKALTADELREISRLTDFQLDASGMAEGAALLWGLDEWEDIKSENLRPAWRFFDGLPVSLRNAMLSKGGLTFGPLGLEARQQFLAVAYYEGESVRKAVEEGTADEDTLKRLARATLRLTYEPDPDNKSVQPALEWHLIARLPESGGQTTLRNKGRTSTSSNTGPE